jgi:putative RNA 2'-phosphotransferase
MHPRAQHGAFWFFHVNTAGKCDLIKRHRIKIERLSRFMVYILGHRPYEFGLVPNQEGFVALKELLWAIHEEPGYTHVSQGNVHEVLLSEDRILFETKDKQIRARDRHWELDLINPVQSLPKLVYLGIRRKAHPVVMEKGLRAIKGRYYPFSSDRHKALRIGRRRDQQSVVLEVMADKAHLEGTLFFPFGNLFLADEIKARYIAGPPVPKHTLQSKEGQPKGKEGVPSPFQAGTFILEAERDMDRSRLAKGKKKKGWKEEVKKLRKKRQLK